MATRSNIIAKFDDENYYGIYCHYDGYLEGVGKTLVNHYNDLDKIAKLFNLGDIRSLGKTVDETETEVLEDEWTSEIGCKSLSEMFDGGRFYFEDFTYVFEDGKWTYFCGDEIDFRIAVPYKSTDNNSINNKASNNKGDSMNVNVVNIKRSTVYQAVCENVYDIINDTPDDPEVVEWATSLITSVLSDPEYVREQIVMGDAFMYLPMDICEKIENETYGPNTIFVITEDDGSIWATFTAKEVQF